MRESNGGVEIEAKCDTGAKRTSVDLEVDVILEDDPRSITASVADRDHLTYDVLLGRDVLNGFRIDLTDVAE